MSWCNICIVRKLRKLTIIITLCISEFPALCSLTFQHFSIEDDHEIARELEQVDISGDKDKCVIQ